jgi:hypothetical protein
MADLWTAIVTVEEARNRARKWFFVNLAIAVAGAVVSLASYAAAASSPEGGTYGIFWGAIAFGGWFALKNAMTWAKCNKVLGGLRSGSVDGPGEYDTLINDTDSNANQYPVTPETWGMTPEQRAQYESARRQEQTHRHD